MIAMKSDEAQSWIFRQQDGQFIPGGISAAIIHKDDFTIAPECVAKALVDLAHGLTFIENRYDDTDLRSLPINRLRGVILYHRRGIPGGPGSNLDVELLAKVIKEVPEILDHPGGLGVALFVVILSASPHSNGDHANRIGRVDVV